MKTTILIILLIIILLLIIPFNIKIKLKFDVIKNKGKLTVKLFNIYKIVAFDFEIKNGYLKTQNGLKQKLIPLDFSSEGLQQYADLNTLIFDKTTLNKCVIFFNFGIKKEPFVTAMACSFVNVFSSILFAFIKNKKSNFIFDKRIFTNFSKDELKFGIKANASITIFDTLWCFAQSKYIFKKIEAKGN